jgi:hypothetical protein
LAVAPPGHEWKWLRKLQMGIELVIFVPEDGRISRTLSIHLQLQYLMIVAIRTHHVMNV